jgi:type IV secretory pathway VirJ component
VTAPAVADLSLVEVPSRIAPVKKTMAIVISGDGGWADIDKSIAAGLVAAGIPVVGWSSPDYYWTPRTPDGAAADLARIIEHYVSTWQIERVLIVGYSFGADVAPLLVNRLPPALKERVTQVALLGPSDTATFEFHLSDWIGKRTAPTHPTAPEIARLHLPITCVFGEDEPDSVCRTAGASGVRAISIGRGHHFGGEYGRIVDAILR